MKGIGLTRIFQPLKSSKTMSWGLRFLCETVLAEGQVDLNPDYQRDHVWTRGQREEFMGHILEGGTVPDVWLRMLDTTALMQDGPLYECVDGKQRLTTMQAWWVGKIPARLSPENGHREIWARELSAEERSALNFNVRVRVQFLEHYTRKEILRVYVRLNAGGTPHSQREIDRVRAMYEAEP